MDNKPRQTSEHSHIRETHHFADKINMFSAYRKTSQEKEALKAAQAHHKKILKTYYGQKYQKKILNLPDVVYEIS